MPPPTKPAKIGFVTAAHKDLISLPPPKMKIFVGVYRFRDQTGQYKIQPNATSFSTMVTQGATSMLVKALEDSGWFIPVEREGLSDILTERKIIRATIAHYKEKQKGNGKKLPELPPLDMASITIEGGIVAYDTDVYTGGFGLKYYGIGGSTQFRVDRVTIYLRAVSVDTGRVLRSVMTNKTILSKEVDIGVYRYVSIKKLLEIETGLSYNEPTQMCVLEAIEKAVVALIVDGIKNHYWELKNPDDINSPVIKRYIEEGNEGVIVAKAEAAKKP
jgi:curli production assembly/transport component CsgG